MKYARITIENTTADRRIVYNEFVDSMEEAHAIAIERNAAIAAENTDCKIIVRSVVLYDIPNKSNVYDCARRVVTITLRNAARGGHASTFEYKMLNAAFGAKNDEYTHMEEVQAECACAMHAALAAIRFANAEAMKTARANYDAACVAYRGEHSAVNAEAMKTARAALYAVNARAAVAQTQITADECGAMYAEAFRAANHAIKRWRKDSKKCIDIKELNASMGDDAERDALVVAAYEQWEHANRAEEIERAETLIHTRRIACAPMTEMQKTIVVRTANGESLRDIAKEMQRNHKTIAEHLNAARKNAVAAVAKDERAAAFIAQYLPTTAQAIATERDLTADATAAATAATVASEKMVVLLETAQAYGIAANVYATSMIDGYIGKTVIAAKKKDSKAGHVARAERAIMHAETELTAYRVSDMSHDEKQARARAYYNNMRIAYNAARVDYDRAEATAATTAAVVAGADNANRRAKLTAEATAADIDLEERAARLDTHFKANESAIRYACIAHTAQKGGINAKHWLTARARADYAEKRAEERNYIVRGKIATSYVQTVCAVIVPPVQSIPYCGGVIASNNSDPAPLKMETVHFSTAPVIDVLNERIAEARNNGNIALCAKLEKQQARQNAMRTEFEPSIEYTAARDKYSSMCGAYVRAVNSSATAAERFRIGMQTALAYSAMCKA